jgi:hypothetical protein
MDFTNIENIVLSEVRELMIFDGVDEEKSKDVEILIKKVIFTKIYVESIKKDFDKILEDKKIDERDISRLMMIMIKLNNILPKMLNLKEKIKVEKMKYIFYSILFGYIRQYQNEFFIDINIFEFRLLYSNLWSLVEIDPETVKVTKKKIFSLCCSEENEVKEQNEPIRIN